MPSPNIPGTHFRGPLLGASNSFGGLWEDMAQQGLWHQGRSYSDYFMTGDPTIAGGNWLATNLVAGTTTVFGAQNASGTAAAGSGGIQLTHNVANQGPSVQFVASVTGPIGQNLYLLADPGTDAFQFSCAIQSRLTKTAGNATAADVYWGFGAGATQNPILATGLLDTVNIVDAAGWINTDAAGTPAATLRPCLMDNGVLRTVTVASGITIPSLPNTGLPGNVYGVRIDSTNTRDIVSWYINGTRVHSQSPGAASGRFSFSMTAYFAIVNESGTATTYQMRNFHFADFLHQT